MFDIFESTLILVAHPDDEVLGVGGLISKLTRKGCSVHICVLADGESSKQEYCQESQTSSRQAMFHRSCDYLGVSNDARTLLSFPDQMLDTIPLLSMLRQVEERISIKDYTAILTHAYEDLNQDHRRCNELVNILGRPTNKEYTPSIITFETPSATEWSPYDIAFKPNLYVELNRNDVDRKFLGLSAYGSELKEWPHTRSIEAIEAKMKSRGSEISVPYAEAFRINRIRL